MAQITSFFRMESLPLPLKYCTIDLESIMLENSSSGWNFLGFNDLSDLTRMENEHYLTRLKHDIDAWNYWRKGNCERLDLTRAQLKGANLKRALLSSIDLSGSNLSRADLRRALLCDARLIGADLNGADLSRSSLTSAHLQNANLAQTSLRWACLIGTDLTEANLSGADLTGADLTDANLTGADLTGANLTGADLTGAFLVDTQALSTNFQGAIFTGVCLADCKVDRTTQLEELIGDYIYLKSGRQGRFPSSGSLALGEISQLLQKVLGAIEPFNKPEHAN